MWALEDNTHSNTTILATVVTVESFLVKAVQETASGRSRQPLDELMRELLNSIKIVLSLLQGSKWRDGPSKRASSGAAMSARGSQMNVDGSLRTSVSNVRFEDDEDIEHGVRYSPSRGGRREREWPMTSQV